MEEAATPDNEYSFGEFAQPQNDATSLKMRLDTQPILIEIERFLRSNGKEGEKRINEYGTNSIMSQLRLRLNTQVVQGNFYVDKHGFSEQYHKYLYYTRISLTEFIVNKRIDFEMKDDEVEGIIDAIMDCIEPFLSRLLGNGERNSYNNTIQTKDTVVHSQRKGIAKLFKS